jgi:DNA-binding Xre family transcriptional regulator
MSYLSQALDSLMTKHGINGATLAKAIGHSEGIVSRWRTGRQSFIAPDTLDLVARHVTQDPLERGELVKAHLLDEIPPIAKDIVRVDIVTPSGDVLSEDPTKYQSSLPPKLEYAIDILRDHATDPDVKVILTGLADLLMRDVRAKMQAVLEPPKEREQGSTARPISGADIANKTIENYKKSSEQ